MARRGRPPLAEPRTSIKVSLPAAQVAILDLRFSDPLTGALRLGERSRYIEALIAQDLARATEQEPEQNEITLELDER